MLNRSRRHLFRISAFVCSVFTAAASFATSTEIQPLPYACVLAQQTETASLANGKMSTPVFPPIPLQVRKVVEPTVFASGGRNFLIYELDLQNYSDTSMSLHGIEVMSSEQGVEKSIAHLDERQLIAILRPTGVDYWQYHTHPHLDANRQLQGGRSAVAFVCLAFDARASIPGSLRHRVQVNDALVDSSLMVVHRDSPVFAPPLAGTDWVPRNGPHLDSHHRMGLVVFDGLAQNSRRFAIDWRKFKNGKQYEGDARDVHSYFAYGEKILAVADGVVVNAGDGYPDNIPRTEAGFELALPLIRENLGGNFVIIALDNGQFAEYFHMQAGSVRIKRGDSVKRGQLIGQVGNSGDARWPHLHFQLTDKPDMFASEGLPFVIDRFRMKTADGSWLERSKEFPWGDETVIDFGSTQDIEKK